MDIRNTTALVTGANGGIGEAIVAQLVAAGANVIVTGRRADALEVVAHKTGARMIVADLAQRDDVTRIAREAGPVDILVANAAIPATGDFATEVDEDFIERTIDVNLKAAPEVATKVELFAFERRLAAVVDPRLHLHSDAPGQQPGFSAKRGPPVRDEGIGSRSGPVADRARAESGPKSGFDRPRVGARASARLLSGIRPRRSSRFRIAFHEGPKDGRVPPSLRCPLPYRYKTSVLSTCFSPRTTEVASCKIRC